MRQVEYMDGNMLSVFYSIAKCRKVVNPYLCPEARRRPCSSSSSRGQVTCSKSQHPVTVNQGTGL